MNRRKFYFFFAGLIAFIFLFNACKPKKEALPSPKPYEKDKGIETKMVFEKLKDAEFRFQTFSAKFNTEMEKEDKKTSVSGYIRIHHDSLIWISITPALGIEVVRVLISNDSIKILNRIEKIYIVTDFNYLNNLLKIDVDFDILQAILTGNDFAYYETDVFKLNQQNGQYHLTTINRRKLKKYVRNENELLRILKQDIWIDTITSKILTLQAELLQKNGKKLQAEFSNFLTIGEQLFPTKAIYKISADTDIKLKIDYSKIETDQILSFSFTIPNSYTKQIGF